MKPLIAISSCLLGEAVRYDGDSKPDDWICHELAQLVDFLPLCPEAAAGLGIPRPPVELVRLSSGIHALGVEHRALDVTRAIVSWSRGFLASMPDVSACILKARSPSCGYLSTPLFDHRGHQLDTVSGLFAQALREKFPALLIVDEDMLATQDGREQFLQSILPTPPL